ncbi:MAG: hypothetical protein ACPIOQ_82835, partial [Promethearchaeia archaeon]
MRKEPDTKSDIIGQPQRDEVLTLVAVKMFGTAVRGRLDTSGWVSIVATGGKVLFERTGDLELQPGTYRTTTEQKLYDGKDGAENGSSLPAGDVELTSVSVGADGASVWGEVSGGKGWLNVYGAASDSTGVVADRIVKGFNDAFKNPDEFEDPPAPNQMMLLSDMVLVWDDEFRKISPKDAIEKLLKHTPNGANTLLVPYAKSPSDADHSGRWYAQGPASLQRLSKTLRSTLLHGLYIDLDFENCGPTLLLNLCKWHGIEHRWLWDIVHNRENMLAEFQPAFTRDEAKDMVVALLYGKSV